MRVEQSLIDKYVKDEAGSRYGTRLLSAYVRGTCVAQMVVSIRNLPEEKAKLTDWLSINFNKKKEN